MKIEYSSENLRKVAEKIPDNYGIDDCERKELEPEIFGLELSESVSFVEMARLLKVGEEFKRNNPEVYKRIEEEIKQIEKRTDVLLGRN